MRCLYALLRRLTKNKEHLHRYDQVIRQYLLEHHAEVVPKDSTGKHVYYKPHKEVIKEDSLTTKLRIVFDASSFGPGQLYLNECLSKGINLNLEVLELLLRFRTHRIGMTADIQKAFLRIGLRVLLVLINTYRAKL